ncbi:MAG: site-specific integrase [Bacteroidales bacterium]|jgi:integrase|nr:site-specific integrase [Bacteroidales bacterium]MCI2121250.1 site-specific integrase [Bacteroidales bacterium]MCI2146154.1 site-specific integrase [Bacteroidales bacterium]
MYIKRNYLFYIASEKGKTDGKLRLRIRWNGDSVFFNLGYRVDRSKWSTETQRCRNNSFHTKYKISSAVINKEIARYEEMADAAFAVFEEKDVIPTKDDMRQQMATLTARKPTEDENFFTIFDRFMDTEGKLNDWSEGTKKKMKTVRHHLYDFKPSLSVPELDNETLESFLQWLLSRGYRNTTIAKDLNVMRWYIRWLTKNGYYSGNVLQTFNPRIKNYDKEVVYLSWDELMHLYSMPIALKQMEYVRDVFCFQCFTGLRFSDVYTLTRDDIRDDCITIVTHKTVDLIRINLNKYSKAILDKYRDFPTRNNKALPVFANQVVNRELKELGRLAGLNEKIKMVYYKGSKRYEDTFAKWQLLTTHCGRRTFVVNAMYFGIPDDVIRSWTGHSSDQAMKPYKKVVDELKKQEMDKFNRD